MKATHYGKMYGIPVLIDMTDSDCPVIECRYKTLEPALDVMEFLFGCFVWVNCRINPDYEPLFPIYIKGEAHEK